MFFLNGVGVAVKNIRNRCEGWGKGHLVDCVTAAHCAGLVSMSSSSCSSYSSTGVFDIYSPADRRLLEARAAMATTVVGNPGLPGGKRTEESPPGPAGAADVVHEGKSHIKEPKSRSSTSRTDSWEKAAAGPGDVTRRARQGADAAPAVPAVTIVESRIEQGGWIAPGPEPAVVARAVRAVRKRGLATSAARPSKRCAGQARRSKRVEKGTGISGASAAAEVRVDHSRAAPSERNANVAPAAGDAGMGIDAVAELAHAAAGLAGLVTQPAWQMHGSECAVQQDDGGCPAQPPASSVDIAACLQDVGLRKQLTTLEREAMWAVSQWKSAALLGSVFSDHVLRSLRVRGYV